MHHLIFATNNSHKVLEVKSLLGSNFTIESLQEAGIFIDIPEPFDTLEANAIEKARVIYQLTGSSCFSEDTGLEVPALGGEPGVKSARYAGDDRSFENNIDKLLSKLKDQTDQAARFRTVICLNLQGVNHLFEGICPGRLLGERRGEGGFGYDPIFVPDGADLTFGEMTLDEKNQYSHRKKAITKLTEFLTTLPDSNSLPGTNTNLQPDGQNKN
ncbi:MAG: RdgB/HAM1 family non-canonical purine NTP pyrophosphatase [Bacteroidota bacterium]|nr:RdgB/HAM1 family non-canonical purine NTP pyrophosphatase [Bacteroidota bacterium]